MFYLESNICPLFDIQMVVRNYYHFLLELKLYGHEYDHLFSMYLLYFRIW